MIRSADEAAIAEAARLLAAGNVIALPTESSYGLAVAALDGAAVDRLAALKGRPTGKAPPILIEPAMLPSLVARVPAAARALMDRHWPGALTLALPARADLPSGIVEGGFVAVRRSPHPVVAKLLAAFGAPITATSANLAGAPPALTAEGAALDGVTLILDGGLAPGAPPSTVARVRDDGAIEIVRPGPVTLGD